MAVPIVPKSECRRSYNIIFGYGEVPAVDVCGVMGWGLPGGEITFREAEARKMARKLDRKIRENMTDLNQLLRAS